MSDSPSNEIRVKDVYDFAYDIAQEFEKIIGGLDTDETIPLINKVINVLELLETSAHKIEHLEKENSELRAKYLKLSNDKVANEVEKMNLKQAFEDLEDSWCKESVSLKSFIAKLKAENKLLQKNLTEKEDFSPEIDEACKTVIEDQENFIAKLKSNLKQKDSQLEQSIITIEKLNHKMEDLLEMNKSLHIRYQEARSLVQSSNVEKSEYEMEIDLQKRKIQFLEEKIDCLEASLKEKTEVGEMTEVFESTEEPSKENFKHLVQEQQELKLYVSKLQMELLSVKSRTDEYRDKLIKLIGHQKVTANAKPGRIQQIFRLFLGIVHFTPHVW